MLIKEGNFTATVIEASLIEHRFEDEFYEIMIEFSADDERGKIFLDLSNKYIQSGTRSGEKQCALTAETLAHFDIDIKNGDLTQLEKLAGKKIEVFGKTNSKGYINYYLNTSKTIVKIDKKVSKDLQALFKDEDEKSTDAIPF